MLISSLWVLISIIVIAIITFYNNKIKFEKPVVWFFAITSFFACMSWNLYSSHSIQKPKTQKELYIDSILTANGCSN